MSPTPVAPVARVTQQRAPASLLGFRFDLLLLLLVLSATSAPIGLEMETLK